MEPHWILFVELTIDKVLSGSIDPMTLVPVALETTGSAYIYS